MNAEQIILPHLWRRYLSLTRALAGMAGLAVSLGARGAQFNLLHLALLLVSVYSIIAAYWRKLERIPNGDILWIVLDSITFLCCAVLAGDAGFWVASFAAFYLILSLASLHTWREIVAVLVVIGIFLMMGDIPESQRLLPILLLVGLMGCIFSVQRQGMMERLSNSSRQAVLYRTGVARAREAERERIAADFHDGPLQSFISFQMRLEIVRRMFERNHDAGMQELQQLRELCEKQVAELRTYIRSMRPVEVEGLGLATALRNVVAAFQKDTRISATFRADMEASHDDIEASTELIQMVREALTNVQKHSGASRVAVTLSRENGAVRLLIEDDGTGFPFAGAFTLDELELLHLGPGSIKRRVRGLNGELTVQSRPGQGSTVSVQVPI